MGRANPIPSGRVFLQRGGSRDHYSCERDDVVYLLDFSISLVNIHLLPFAGIHSSIEAKGFWRESIELVVLHEVLFS